MTTFPLKLIKETNERVYSVLAAVKHCKYSYLWGAFEGSSRPYSYELWLIQGHYSLALAADVQWMMKHLLIIEKKQQQKEKKWLT